ncbi:MAG: FtsX-like permease family protein [Bacteroides sp.]|nr:FtsX-like permease family protein [Bacteroides sp.]
MKRDLLIQMRNEWRDNLWLIIGLAIVSFAIWWLTMNFYQQVSGLFYEKGFDVEDVYMLDISKIPSDSPEFIERSEEERAFLDSQDLRMLIANIRNSQYVEAAAFSQNGLPYNFSYYGSAIYLDTEPKDTIGYSGNFRNMSPDMVKVLKLKSRTGKNLDELENILRSGSILVSNMFSYWSANYRAPEEFLDQNVILNYSDKTYRVGDIIHQIRRSDYAVEPGGMVIFPINEEENLNADAVAIRIKPGMGEKFREEFENDRAMQQYGNYIFYKLTKMTDQAKSAQKSHSTNARMGFALIMSLLIIIGLGMLGVFWFRTQQRISEIAIRKVCGAKSSDIFRRILSEGMLLLIIATLVVAAVGWPLMKATLLKESEITNMTVFYSELITLAIVALGITVSLWWPAHRAMKIEPAIAIKDE